MKGIKLQIPRQDPSRNPVIDVRPKGVKRWLESLPAANVNETISQLFPVLKEINRTPIDLPHRHNFMTQIEPLVTEMVKTIKKRYSSTTLPLTPRTLVNVNVVRELYREMAFAYKLMIVELTHRECAEEEEDVILKSSLYHAIRSLSQIMLETYIVYENEPQGIWSELHKLYQFAEKNPLLFTKEKKTSDKLWTNPAIDAYKRIILLALTNPYQLMQGEANRIDHHLETWASDTKIHKPGTNDTFIGKFVIDLATDAPPRCITASMKGFSPIDGRIIDAAALVDRVKVQAEKLSEPVKGKGKKSLSFLGRRQRRDMFVRLEKVWNTRSERFSSRTMNLSKMIMATGLSASHYFVSGEVTFNPERHEVDLQKQSKGRSSEGKSSISILSSEEEAWQEQEKESRLNRGIVKPRVSRFDTGEEKDQRDMWIGVYATEAHRLLGDDNEQEDQPNYTINLWNQRGDSSGGLSLFCNYGQATDVNVGELVALKAINSSPDAEWGIGMIRWIRIQQQDSVHAGIKLLSEDAIAVATKGLKGIGAGSEYYRSLLLPKLNPREHPTTLITPAAVYDIDSLIVINLEDTLIYARITRLVQSTKSFSQFQFEISDAPGNIKEHVSSLRSERRFK